MTRAALIVSFLVAAACAAACAPDAPTAPTWDDVQPILAANCIRCHGAEPRLGAPRGFRLDLYDETFVDGAQRRGAAQMAEFIAERAGRLGEMPPDYPLYDRQRDILVRWFETRPNPMTGGSLPLRGDPAANHPPTVALVDPPGSAVDQTVTLGHVAADEDGELLSGNLAYASVASCATPVGTAVAAGIVTDELRDGRGAVTWDTGPLPPGGYLLTATVTDATGSTTTEVGCVDVVHASGNTAPLVAVVFPGEGRDALLADVDSPATIRFTVTEFDAADVPALRAAVEAFHGDTVLPLVSNIGVAPGQNELAWDTTAVPASVVTGADAWQSPIGWRIRVTVTDGKASRTAVSGYFFIGHEPVAETFTTIHADILTKYCTPCHLGQSGMRVPGVTQDLDRYDNINGAGFDDRRGLIFRRAVQLQEMPPPSGATLIDGPIGAPLPPDLRERLARWLLAGAPP